MLPPASILIMPTLALTPELRLMFPPAFILSAPVPEVLMLPLTMMSVVAFSVSWFAELQKTGSTTLMNPAPLPLVFAVVTVTDELASAF